MWTSGRRLPYGRALFDPTWGVVTLGRLRSRVVRRHLGGPAGDESARHQLDAAFERVPFDGTEQLRRRRVTELGEIEVDGGQRRPAAFGHHLPVVDSDDADLLRHGSPGLSQSVGDAPRDLV